MFLIIYLGEKSGKDSLNTQPCNVTILIYAPVTKTGAIVITTQSAINKDSDYQNATQSRASQILVICSKSLKLILI